MSYLFLCFCFALKIIGWNTGEIRSFYQEAPTLLQIFPVSKELKSGNQHSAKDFNLLFT